MILSNARHKFIPDLKQAPDVEKVTRKFYAEFRQEHLDFLGLVGGIQDERDRRRYAAVMLNRLMFIYFLQRKHLLDGGDTLYLQNKLKESKLRAENRYYGSFLRPLFFEGFALPEGERDAKTNSLLGKIKYLGGGLFAPHPIEERWPKIEMPDEAFDNLFALFGRYSWNLNDTPGGNDNELNPDVLGYIFEKYINRKAFGAYYTRPEITDYLCERTVHQLILDRINALTSGGRRFDSMAGLLTDLDAPLCGALLNTILPELSLLDPACGSGAFLVAAMKTLVNVYSATVGKIKFLNDTSLTKWLGEIERDHKNISYFIKKRIITDNLYGVDVMEEATEIAKLRLFLALVASAGAADQLEPLPNVDFNIMSGNSLVGLMHVGEKEFNRRNAQGDLSQSTYRQILDEKNRLIDDYRHAALHRDDLRGLRNKIDEARETAAETLNAILLEDFNSLGIKFEEATWDDAKKREGKARKRKLNIADIEALRPFHWGYEFDEIINRRGGFDAIITNPPWEIFKPVAKEFCYEFDPEIERRGTNIKDFEGRLAVLLKNKETLLKFLQYKSRFPHVSLYYRNASQYKNQVAVVNDKKAGTDINLFKLFTEQCFNLLRDGGECGTVIPSGIYSDLGAKRLREMLFDRTKITGLFCFENRKEIFEGVHRSFKFVVLTFRRGEDTERFPSAFMRHDVEELALFPGDGALRISVDLIRKSSPDSLSVMEFKSETDVRIAEKMLRFPLLGGRIEGKWNLVLTREFDMTNDSHLFRSKPGPGLLPLYEGKMIWLFEHGKEEPRYWIPEEPGADKCVSARVRTIRKLFRERGLAESFDGSAPDLSYKHYRLGFRAVTGATNARALVVSIIPRHVFAGNSLIVSAPFEDRVMGQRWTQQANYTHCELLFCLSIMGSFACDWFIRQKILTNMNMFYVYQLPVPRLMAEDAGFVPVVSRAARLVCTTPEYAGLWESVKAELRACGYELDDALRLNRNPGGDFKTPEDERAAAGLRAELDGMAARLYQLTEDEFAHVLATFPLAADPAKEAALRAYRDLAPVTAARPENRTLALKPRRS